VLLLICWMLGYAGIVYGLGAFRTLVLKHYGFSSHFIFAAGGITAVVGGGLGFLINSWTNERIDRRTAIGISTFVFALGTALLYFYSGYHTRSVPMTVASMLLTSFGSGVFLFQMYNYTSAAYPTRLRSVGTGWTDGVGHIGALIGSPVVVALYNATAASGFIGAYLFVIIVGAVIPGALMWALGIRQKEVILEEVSR
jgi:putative MFS transporter